jgi:hypothetical protein
MGSVELIQATTGGLMRPAVKREWAAAFIGVKIQLHHRMVDANRPASKDDGL